MSELALISKLISHARSRLLWNAALAELVFSVNAALAGVILILLAGTQLLDWYWLVFLLAGSGAIGIYRIRRRIPGPYVAAQILDRRAGLPDSLSTALFFSRAPQERRFSAEMREAQLRQAASLAQQVALSKALPFTMPRATYAMVALALVASSLFGLRYGLERRIDLRPTLARVVLETFNLNFEQRAENQKKTRGGKRADFGQNLGFALEDKNSHTPGELDAAPSAPTDSGDIPDVNNIQKPGPEQPDSKTKGSSPGSQLSEGEPLGEKAGDAEKSSGSEGASEGQNGDQRGEKSAAGQGSPSTGDSSLISKLRDAMSNLLSRMRQQSPNGNSQMASSKGQAQLSGKQAKPGQNGSPGPGRQQSSDGQAGQSQEGQQAGDSEDAQNAQGKGKGSEQDSTRAAGSGIGRQDGDKEAKLAEQLAAMGKISEIIGKRSQNVTGEVTIEVRSGKQQLRTPYSQTNANHTEGGGEINRDEVPVLYQQYVRQYFEQVRKNDTAPKAR